MQQAGASVLGVLIAFATWHIFGLDAVSLGAAVLVGLIVGSVVGLVVNVVLWPPPRRAVPSRMQAAEGFAPIVNRLAQAVAETRSMAHTIQSVPARSGITISGDALGLDRTVTADSGGSRGSPMADADEVEAARVELTAQQVPRPSLPRPRCRIQRRPRGQTRRAQARLRSC